MKCIKCNNEIDPLRLKALPGVKTCISCSQVNRVAGFAIISGKTTYSELQIMPQDQAEELLKKQNRTTGVSEGVRFKNQPPPKFSNLE